MSVKPLHKVMLKAASKQVQHPTIRYNAPVGAPEAFTLLHMHDLRVLVVVVDVLPLHWNMRARLGTTNEIALVDLLI